MDKNREIKVSFFSGETGTGKTTFAKRYCESANKSYCVSSSSNDPMQDYKGEDVLILDDLRDSDYKFTDLLKILDNHTKSTMKSRYHNKAFIGDMIIITSYRPLHDWYFDIPSESKHQLYRRISEMYKFTKERIYAYAYSVDTGRYEQQGSMRNIVAMKPREQVKLALTVCDALGVEFEEDVKNRIDDALVNKSDEEWGQIVMDDDVENPFKIG